jgi:hypothetical protein
MNAMNDVAEARASALSLRASARACTREQGALKFRLIRAAESLDAMVLLAVRGFDRIEQLEQQLAAVTAGSGEPAKGAALGRGSARSSTIPADTPITPVIVAGVDVAPPANIVSLVENAASDEWATEGAALRASLRMTRVPVQETFEDLQAASARGAS